MTTRNRGDGVCFASAATYIYIYHAAHNAVTQPSRAAPARAARRCSRARPRARSPRARPSCCRSARCRASVVWCRAAAPAGRPPPTLRARARAACLFLGGCRLRLVAVGSVVGLVRVVAVFVSRCVRCGPRGPRARRAAEPKWNHEPRRRPSSRGKVPNYSVIPFTLRCTALHCMTRRRQAMSRTILSYHLHYIARHYMTRRRQTMSRTILSYRLHYIAWHYITVHSIPRHDPSSPGNVPNCSVTYHLHCIPFPFHCMTRRRQVRPEPARPPNVRRALLAAGEWMDGR